MIARIGPRRVVPGPTFAGTVGLAELSSRGLVPNSNSMKVRARSLLLAVIFLTNGLSILGQSVFIPDTNLWAWFNDLSPGLVDANGYMDTTEAQSTISGADLDVTWGPSDLTGLQYLTNLGYLRLTYLPGTEGQSQFIPAWPPGLWSLSISGYNGSQILPFPSGLEELQISGCSTLDQIPPLPAGLISLGVHGMPLLNALPALPSTMVHLNLGAGLPQITSLPAFPNGMWSLAAHDISSLIALPTLPEGFLSLEMSGLPLLTALPDLPSSLQVLRLSTGMNVPLDTLPGELVELQLAHQPFAGLPSLPGTLEILELVDLPQLQSLPALPSGLRDIGLFGLPQLACLPQVPDTTWLAIVSTGLTCVPNHPLMLDGGIYVSYADYWGVGHLPLCTVLNSTCPNINGVITGRAYHDLDGDGALDLGENGWGAATVLIEPGGFLSGVDDAGYFQVAVPEGQYTVSAQANSPHTIGISPAYYTADASAGAVDPFNDFGVALTPGIVDLGLDMTASWAFVPGSARSVVLTCRNVGSTEVVGSVTLSVGEGSVITGADPLPTMFNDSTALWALGPMPAGAVRMIVADLLTDTTALIGMPIELVSELLPTVGDATPTNNTVTVVDTVLASFDPNDKRVEPPSITPDQAAAGEELEYTIRFQNTGTFQANRVIITDTLSTDLQWNTMRFIASSHPCTWVLLGNGVLRFTFDPIFLPDSTSDEPNSHGFVKFAMKPSTSLMLGESVGNTANIYFDFNEPIITNEAVFTVEASTSLEERRGDGLLAWPNPVGALLFVEGGAAAMAEVLDLAGRVVIRQRLPLAPFGLDISGLATGSYVVRLDDGRAAAFMKR